MQVLVEGSGGSSGWPQPGCRCASCLRQAADGNVTDTVDHQSSMGGCGWGSGTREPGTRRGRRTAAGRRGRRAGRTERAGRGAWRVGRHRAGRGAAALPGGTGGGARAAGGRGAL